MNILYAISTPSPAGGMSMISKMMHDAGVFDREGYFFFATNFTCGTSKLRRFVQSIRHKFRFASALSQNSIDAVFIMTSSYWGFFDKLLYALIARMSGRRVALNIVGGGFREFYEQNFLTRLLVNVSIRIPHVLVAGTDTWHHYFRKTFPSCPTVIIPNPVSLKPLAEQTSRYHRGHALPQVLFIGRMVEDKGIPELSAVIRHPLLDGKVTFAVVGDGPMLPALQKELFPENESGKATLYGFAEEGVKMRLLGESDLYFLPTRVEVLPVAVLEAMAAGLPVVSTTVGGIPDVVSDGINGYLTPPGDTDAMAAAILRLSESPELRSSFGQVSRERAHRYELEGILEEHRRVLGGQL